MTLFSSILVPVEPASSAESLELSGRQAAVAAVRLAECSSAQLTVLSVTEPAGWFSAASDIDAARQSLNSLAAEMRTSGCAVETKFVEQATPWETIVREVQTAGHDLVVVGVGSRGGVGRLLFGSTGLRLLRYCPCPVLLTKPDLTLVEPTLLVADDLGDTGLRALRMAVETASLTGGSVHVVHAVDCSIERRILLVSHEGRYEAERQQRIAEAKSLTDERIALMRSEFADAAVTIEPHICEGVPEVVILETIASLNPDLLVMGTRGRVGVAGLVLGNTAEKLVPRVSCSLLAIKPAGYTAGI